MSKSSHTKNKTNNILVLGKNFVKLINTTIQAEDELKTNCPAPHKKNCIVLVIIFYNGDNFYLFVNNVQQYKFKKKDSEIKANKLILGNITYKFPLTNMNRIDISASAYDFSGDYQSITTDKIQKFTFV